MIRQPFTVTALFKPGELKILPWQWFLKRVVSSATLRKISHAISKLKVQQFKLKLPCVPDGFLHDNCSEGSTSSQLCSQYQQAAAAAVKPFSTHFEFLRGLQTHLACLRNLGAALVSLFLSAAAAHFSVFLNTWSTTFRLVFFMRFSCIFLICQLSYTMFDNPPKMSHFNSFNWQWRFLPFFKYLNFCAVRF